MSVQPAPGTSATAVTVAQLQQRLEALFIEARGLEAEVIRLRALHPLMIRRPSRPPLLLRLVYRLLPRLRRPRDIRTLRDSGLFDAAWYLEHNPDVRAAGSDPVRHFLDHGAAEGRDPGPHFSTAHYLALYPDIRDGGHNPLLHYLTAGWDEGRSIRPGMPPRTA